MTRQLKCFVCRIAISSALTLAIQTGSAALASRRIISWLRHAPRTKPWEFLTWKLASWFIHSKTRRATETSCAGTRTTIRLPSLRRTLAWRSLIWRCASWCSITESSTPVFWAWTFIRKSRIASCLNILLTNLNFQEGQPPHYWIIRWIDQSAWFAGRSRHLHPQGSSGFGHSSQI